VNLSPAEIAALEAALPTMSAQEKTTLLEQLEAAETAAELAGARGDLLQFAHRVYPNFSVGSHHRVMARLFKDVVEGRKSRIIINMPPRHSKSETTSYLLPAWFFGHKPDAKVIMATHTQSLSEDFGRRVRNLIADPDYQEIFPETSLQTDSKSAGVWGTKQGGRYYAVGVGGALAGRGADLLIIDDAHSEQDIKTGTRLAFDMAWNWYQTGPRQRLQWGGAVIVCMTRWATYDLTARLLDYAAKNPDADQWEVVEFPAILPSGKSLWPEKWPLEELLKTKASLDSKYWSAQYMQNPSSDEAAIIGRQEWRVWEKEKPPKCTYLIQCLDAAAETNNRSDYTSITTWGVFQNDSEREEHQIILLDRVNERMQFPELKAKSIEQFKRWEPDAFIVEKKSSGSALYQELRFMGLPVQEYTPHRGSGDKVARLNAVADIVRSGKVWIPDTWWARELIDQVAQFPNGAHDDDVDTTSMALMRFRQGRYLTLETDDALNDKSQFYGRRAAYY
jgi:predicted phage terminase large subunit-like protein